LNKVIFWDFDGTLVHFTSWRLAIMDVLDEYKPGHNISHDDIRPYLKDGFPWHRSKEPHFHLAQLDDWWKALEPLFTGCFQGAGCGKDAPELAKRVRRQMTHPDRFPLYDDAPEVLATLKSRGWANIILSNHMPELPEIVKAMPISVYIDGCHTSAVTGYEKPHSRAFRLALERAGNPDKVWMVGDNIKSDIQGAEGIGIPAILVHNPPDGNVRYHTENLIDIIKIVEGNNNA
jgi:putative hydrolase of the HAD superfamily